MLLELYLNFFGLTSFSFTKRIWLFPFKSMTVSNWLTIEFIMKNLWAPFCHAYLQFFSFSQGAKLKELVHQRFHGLSLVSLFQRKWRHFLSQGVEYMSSTRREKRLLFVDVVWNYWSFYRYGSSGGEK